MHAGRPGTLANDRRLPTTACTDRASVARQSCNVAAPTLATNTNVNIVDPRRSAVCERFAAFHSVILVVY